MAAASTAFVDTGVSWIPTTQRVYQSIPTVNSACTHRKVTGSRANTSSRVVSINRYSPGRVGRSFVRAVQVVEYSREGLAEIADQIVTFAVAEDLPAHGEAISARF